MPDFKLTSDRFPEGTSVAVYAASSRRDGAVPGGSSVASGTITAGAVTFTALAPGPYVAYAQVSGQHRYVAFTVTAGRSAASLAVGKHAQLPLVAVEATVDLPSIPANTTSNVDVPLPAGSCEAGDIACRPLGWQSLNHGLVIQQAHIIAKDSVRLRVSNLTAGAIDAAAVQATFPILRR